MRLVADANVALAWVLDLPWSDEANRLLDPEHGLLAPDVLWPEVTNALHRQVWAGRLSEAEALDRLEMLRAVPVETVATELLATEALRMSVALEHSAYDCFYLAFAMLEDAELATTDRRLAAYAGRAGVRVRLLG